MSINTILACIIILFLVFLLIKPQSPKSSKKLLQEPAVWPFEARQLMSVPERRLYWQLIRTFPDMIVLAQVQASRTLNVQKGQNKQYWFNRICRTSYDFVICDQKTSFPIAVIELDDSSHDTSKRRADDERKNKALAGAKLRIIRLRVNQIPNDNELRQMILSNR